MSSSSKPTSIDHLPPEMISELFKHLDLKDLIVCSQVNKRWYSIYADFRLYRLISIDDSSELEFHKWCHHPDRSVQQKELCPTKMFCRLADQPLLSSLKHLALCDNATKFDLNDLNRFSLLVHLEIKGHLGIKTVTLNLPQLRLLAIHQLNDSCQLSIDCPELNVLVYRGEMPDKNLLYLNDPETIRKLETNMFGSKLARFKNVECLVTREFEVIRKATLSLPKLTELHYNASISMLWFGHSAVGTLARVKETLREFLDDLKMLKGSDFKFTLAGFQLTEKMLDKIGFGVQLKVDRDEIVRERISKEYVYMKNYQLIEPGALHFVNSVDYSRLVASLTGGIPDCFSRKFSRIEWVHVTSAVRDEARLLQFLSSLSWLRGLSLEEAELSQEFFDQLPASAHSLTQLTLGRGWGQDKEREIRLNFNFIDQLPQLSELFIRKFSWICPLTSLFERLDRFRRASFAYQLGDEQFNIFKEKGSKEWQILERTTGVIAATFSATSFKNQSHDEIFNFLYIVQSSIKRNSVYKRSTN